MIRRLAFLFSVSAAALLALALFLAGLPWPGLALLLFFAFWAYSFFQDAAWAAPAGLIVTFSFAALGIFWGYQASETGINFLLLLVASLLALAGWDLADFSARLNRSAPQDQTGPLQLRHLLRLGLVLLSGFLLAMLTLNWQLSLPFGWMVTLALLSALGLGFIIRSLNARVPLE